MADNTLKIEMPWPPRALSPNARVHWSKRAAAAKKYRAWAMLLTLNALGGVKPKLKSTDGKIDVHVVFRPSTNRRRDLDNCISSFKSGFDGVADALEVNDTRFRLTAEIGAVMKRAVVEVTVT